jgi:hypothetical protein
MKKLIFAAAIIFSAVNAHAGYLQYNLSGGGIDNAFGPSFIIIRDTDKSIAYYRLHTQLGYFSPSMGYQQDFLTDSSSNFWGLQTRNMNWGIGPTNFSLKDIMQEEHTAWLTVNFTQGENPTTFNYSMYSHNAPGPYSPYPNLFHYSTLRTGGTAVTVQVDPYLASILDSNPDYGLTGYMLANYILPTQNLPEPGSLALIGLGGLGLAGIMRRKT